MWSDLKLCYTQSKGHPALRKEIAGLYKVISPEDLLVITPEEGILIALNAILQPGDGVIALYPAYQSLLEIPRALGCKVKAWPLEATDHDSWTLDLNKLESSIDNRTKLLIVNFPHNPSGFLPSTDLFREIVNLAERNHLYIFKEHLIGPNMEIIKKNRSLAEEFFGKHPQTFQWLTPKAGSTAFPLLRADIPVETFCKDVVMKKSLMILPGTVFDESQSPYVHNHFRVGLGRKDFPEALAKLGEYLTRQ